jgi:hypothetical protein
MNEKPRVVIPETASKQEFLAELARANAAENVRADGALEEALETLFGGRTFRARLVAELLETGALAPDFERKMRVEVIASAVAPYLADAIRELTRKGQEGHSQTAREGTMNPQTNAPVAARHRFDVLSANAAASDSADVREFKEFIRWITETEAFPGNPKFANVTSARQAFHAARVSQGKR